MTTKQQDQKLDLIYAGQRLNDDKLIHAWIDSGQGNKLRLFDKAVGYAIGGVYACVGFRNGDDLSIYSTGAERPHFKHQIEDEEQAAIWKLQDADAKSRYHRAVLAARLAKDGSLRSMLLPLRRIIHKRSAWAEREAFVQVLATELRRPLSTEEEKS
jgi:hypothetical protein